MKRQIVFDFDKIMSLPDNVFGSVEKFLKYFCKKYKCIIFTTRYPNSITKWLLAHDLDRFIEEITKQNNSDEVYQIVFNGDELRAHYEVKSAKYR